FCGWHANSRLERSSSSDGVMGLSPNCGRPLLSRPGTRVFEGNRLSLRVGGQSSQHPPDDADPDPRFARRGEPLVVLPVTPVAPPPGETPSRDPSLRQLHDPFRPFRPLYPLALEPPLLPRHPRVEGMVAVFRIAPDCLQTRESRAVELSEHLGCR